MSKKITQKEARKNVLPHCFKPGQSGNPNGRPAGSKNIKTLLKEALKLVDRRVVIDELTGDAVEGGLSNGQIIVTKLVATAKKGDLRAIEQVLDRTLGKPVQTIDTETTYSTPPWLQEIHELKQSEKTDSTEADGDE